MKPIRARIVSVISAVALSGCAVNRTVVNAGKVSLTIAAPRTSVEIRASTIPAL